MKKIKKLLFRCITLYLFIHFCITMMKGHSPTEEIKHSYLENFARNIIRNELFSKKMFSETLILIKSSSFTDEQQMSSFYSYISQFNMKILTITEDNNQGFKLLLFDNIFFSEFYTDIKGSELTVLTDWLSRQPSNFTNSINYLIYIDLINFAADNKDILKHLQKSVCLKCVCFFQNYKQKLLGFSGSKIKAIKLYKQKKLTNKLEKGLDTYNIPSTKTVLLDGIVELQYCNDSRKHNVCIEQYTNGTNITKEDDMQKQIGKILKDEVLHIVYATSMDQIKPMVISIKSILKTTSMKSRLHFHIFYYTNNLENHLEELKQLVTGCRARITFHRYNGLDEVEPLINKEFIGRPDLSSPNNYIRFLLHKKLPALKWCLWLDNDVFVLKDIIPVFAKVYTEGDNKAVASFPTLFKTPLNEARVELFATNGVHVSEYRYPRIQAGILFYNLNKWRRDQVFTDILKISKINRELKVYKQWGSQAPLEILFNGYNFYHLDSNLLTGRLGFRMVEIKYIPCDVIFLHWNGPKKPWITELEERPHNILFWNLVLNKTKDLKC